MIQVLTLLHTNHVRPGSNHSGWSFSKCGPRLAMTTSPRNEGEMQTLQLHFRSTKLKFFGQGMPEIHVYQALPVILIHVYV